MESIVNYQYVKNTDYEFIRNTYELQTNNKIIKFLIDFAINKKWLKPYQRKIVTYNTKIINFDKISKSITELYAYLYSYTGEAPVSVMLGRKQAYLLENECVNYIRFSMPLELYRDGIKKFMNLEIIVNPFIDGIVLLNKDMLK